MKILSKEEVKIELDKIITYGVNDITIDIEDINIIIKNKDLVVMDVYENSSDEAAYKIINSIVSDFKNNELPLMHIGGILVHFKISYNYNVRKLGDAMDIIDNRYDTAYITDEPAIAFCTSCDDSLDIDYVKATVFIGYFKKEEPKYVNNFLEVTPI